ncbi:ABC transporter ATP-binding protein [Ancylobacter sp. IITR112]|uniref:ABC transporter ATP-binding protein n=1 Tax=Ancylobacter sp. IITR112 TaxID=3138073 RepID=UPI00352BAE2B
MAALLEATTVCKSYGDFHALTNVSFSISDGEFISIVGPNGAGKSTLVNVLTGLLRPTSGQVSFRGSDIGGIGPVELARRGMARGFQLVNIFPALTVREALCVAASSRLQRIRNPLRSLRRDSEVHEAVEEVADIFHLRHRLDQQARALSQGEKKLLDVASAFALKPELILIDEPTSGVSTGDKHAIMELLVAACRKAGVRAIIQVEHDMDLVARYSDRIVALQAGRVLANEKPETFFKDPALIAAVVGTRRPQMKHKASDAAAAFAHPTSH